MGNQRYPGPVCTVLKDWLHIDPGTQCRGVSPTPGPASGAAVGLTEAEAKEKYLAEARDVSYLMQAKTLMPGDHSSWLGGPFLRMYLDHKVDQDVVDKAGQEIEASKTFADLQKDTNAHLQTATDRHGRLLIGKEIADEARGYLQGRKHKSGIAFRGPLNPVIGGVGGIDVQPAVKITIEPQGASRAALAYEIDVVVSDTYNFENRRTGEYDHYRKYLAYLLKRDRFEDFEEAYFTEVQPVGSWHKTHLDKAALFASFMYALEKRGWTPGGLDWQVTIPMRGKLHAKAPVAKAAPAPNPHHGAPGKK